MKHPKITNTKTKTNESYPNKYALERETFGRREKNEIKGDSEKTMRENNGLDLDAHRSVQGAFVRIQFSFTKMRCFGGGHDRVVVQMNGCWTLHEAFILTF